jgi:hypothetical protein
MNQHSDGASRYAPRARAELAGTDAQITVIGCVGLPLHHVEIEWPWSPLDQRTTAELEWLRTRTGATRHTIIGALVDLGHQQAAA